MFKFSMLLTLSVLDNSDIGKKLEKAKFCSFYATYPIFHVAVYATKYMVRLCGFTFHHRFAYKMFSGLSFFDKHIKIRYLLRVIQEGNKMFDTRG